MLIAAHRSGLLSQTDLARELGVNRATWGNWINREQVPRPTHKVGWRYYYNVEEAAEIAKMLKEAK